MDQQRRREKNVPDLPASWCDRSERAAELQLRCVTGPIHNVKLWRCSSFPQFAQIDLRQLTAGGGPDL